MDNLAREKKAVSIDIAEGRRIEYIDINKERPGNWQYIDVDKFEAQIRAEETAKWVAIRKRERERKKLRKEALISTIMATLVVRLIGVAMIFLGTSLCLYFHCGEGLIAVWPMGILFVICPGHNNINNNIDEYIKKNNKEDKHNVWKD